jgi:ABC-type phosphate transport system permease subunit
VLLPLARPAILAGVAMSGARALGEFGATITFAGNLQGRTQTLPLAVFVVEPFAKRSRIWPPGIWKGRRTALHVAISEAVPTMGASPRTCW